jgi:hypothetical protein
MALIEETRWARKAFDAIFANSLDCSEIRHEDSRKI